MNIDFDALPDPEPSALTGFAQNRIVRDSEWRTAESLAAAMTEDSPTRGLRP